MNTTSRPHKWHQAIGEQKPLETSLIPGTALGVLLLFIRQMFTSIYVRLSIFDGAYLFKHTHVVRIMCKSARLHDAPAVRHIRTAPYQKSKQIHYLKSVKARHRSAGQRCIKHAACMGRNPAACLQFSQQWSEGCIRRAWLVCILMQGEIILGITMITE